VNGQSTSHAQAPALDHTDIAALNLLDPGAVDWSRVRRTAYLIHQRFRYEYPGPIHDLCQRLIIVPPTTHGDQRHIVHRLEVSAPHATTVAHADEFGNGVITVTVPTVEQAIDFEAWIVVERRAGATPHLLPSATLSDQRLLRSSPLTRPDAALTAAAAALAAAGPGGLDLAERINAWAHRALGYAHEVTDIHTPAAEALVLGRGVCQDYAHIMLTLCRLCGLPARYVSGHLLGEGGTHAWVEALLPGPTGEAVVYAFDPTHDRRATLGYITVAVGRDYLDVAPTSGTFRASHRGLLSAHKRVDLTEVEYSPL